MNMRLVCLCWEQKNKEEKNTREKGVGEGKGENKRARVDALASEDRRRRSCHQLLYGFQPCPWLVMCMISVDSSFVQD